MKLNVGDYVRTKKGIAKIIDRINDPTNYYDKFWVCDRYLELNDDTEYIHEQDIIGEPKENIIDLIRVGDYVNGLLVDKNKYGELFTAYVYYGGDIGKQCEVYTTWLKDYREDMIERIVTKEQFEQIEYKVGN